MIVGFTGRMGSGKTLSLTREVFKYHLQGNKIYSNMHFNFPYTPLTLSTLLEYNTDDNELQDCVVVIDEAHVFLDSRTSMTKRNLIISYFLTQTRKKSVKLFFTTQHIMQVDKRLRENCDIIIECENFLFGEQLLVINNTFFVFDNRYKKNFFTGNKFFSLYDTNQIIKI